MCDTLHSVISSTVTVEHTHPTHLTDLTPRPVCTPHLTDTWQLVADAAQWSPRAFMHVVTLSLTRGMELGGGSPGVFSSVLIVGGIACTATAPGSSAVQLSAEGWRSDVVGEAELADTMQRPWRLDRRMVLPRGIHHAAVWTGSRGVYLAGGSGCIAPPRRRGDADEEGGGHPLAMMFAGCPSNEVMWLPMDEGTLSSERVTVGTWGHVAGR